MQVSRYSLARIASFVMQSEDLEELDLSWNNLQPNDFVPLFHVLSANRTLVHLNLSCNMIIDKADCNKEYDLKFGSALEEYV